MNNPEVEVNVEEDNGIISVQIYNLKLITGNLQNAYNGIEVDGSNVDIGEHSLLKSPSFSFKFLAKSRQRKGIQTLKIVCNYQVTCNLDFHCNFCYT